MIVAAAGSASAMTPPTVCAAAPPPEPNAPAPNARPARLDRPIWLNTDASLESAASGAAAKLAGSTEASVLIVGAAVVHPWGTDKLPTRAARPIAPDATGPPALVRFAPSCPAMGAKAPPAALAG